MLLLLDTIANSKKSSARKMTEQRPDNLLRRSPVEDQ